MKPGRPPRCEASRPSARLPVAMKKVSAAAMALGRAVRAAAGCAPASCRPDACAPGCTSGSSRRPASRRRRAPPGHVRLSSPLRRTRLRVAKSMASRPKGSPAPSPSASQVALELHVRLIERLEHGRGRRAAVQQPGPGPLLRIEVRRAPRRAERRGTRRCAGTCPAGCRAPPAGPWPRRPRAAAPPAHRDGRERDSWRRLLERVCPQDARAAIASRGVARASPRWGPRPPYPVPPRRPTAAAGAASPRRGPRRPTPSSRPPPGGSLRSTRCTAL